MLFSGVTNLSLSIQGLNDKSRVGIIVDFILSVNLRNYVFQPAKKCEMTSFSLTSLHVDLNAAAKCVDINTIHIASLLIAPSHTCAKYKMATIFGLTYEDSLTNL